MSCVLCNVRARTLCSGLSVHSYVTQCVFVVYFLQCLMRFCTDIQCSTVCDVFWSGPLGTKVGGGIFLEKGLILVTSQGRAQK